MADTDPKARVAGELYTLAMLDRMKPAIGEWLLAVERPEALVAAELAAALYTHQIGLIDLTRRQALIDERVYGAALARLRQAEQLLANAGLHQPMVEMTDADLGEC